MKKTVVYLLVLAFVVSIAGIAFARTLEEERDAVRAYLKVIDAKIINYRNAGNNAKMVVLQKEKQATLARWNKLKESMEAAPPSPVAPVAPIAPSAPVAVKPAVSAGLFGMGINTCLSGLYVNTGKGQLGGTLGVVGNWVLDDFVGLGPMVGLSASAVKYTVGAGYVNGGGGIQGIPAYAGGIVNLPADMLGGLESYLSGGVNYVLYGNGKTTGKIGLDASFGINADLGLGLGKTGFAVGYSIVRSNLYSSKGIAVSVSQPIVL